MNKQFILLGSILAVIALGVGLLMLQKSSRQPQGNILHVTASFYPLYFFAQESGGDQANVANIVPSGAEPHDYEPTPQDIVRIEASDMLFLNGAGLELWGKNIQTNLAGKETRIVLVGESLATNTIEEGGKTIVDPHVWLSPPLAEKMVDIMAQAYQQVDPAHASAYQANTTTLKKKLQDLDSEYRQGLRSCASKDIVTSHAAFGYLVQAYGLNQVPIAGLSPDAEPSPRQLADIAQFTRARHVRYIFFESLVSPKLAQTIANEVGAKTLVLNPLEGLSNEDVAQGKDYFTQMRQNLANLQIALQCKV